MGISFEILCCAQDDSGGHGPPCQAGTKVKVIESGEQDL